MNDLFPYTTGITVSSTLQYSTYKSHSCIRHTPEIGEKYWGKALIAIIRRTPKIGKTVLRQS